MEAVLPRLTVARRAQFYWKSAILAVTTVALVPILLWKHELAATVYLVFLVLVHVFGPFIVFYGVGGDSWASMWANRRTFWIRVAAIAILLGLLFLASKGLQGDVGSGVFWASLFSIWALHTGALLLLHLRGRELNASCPFV